MKDPYVYEGSNVLKNLADIHDQNKLNDFETTLSRLAIVELLKNPIEIKSTEDIFPIHEKLFKDVYSWAGKPRLINIYKTEQILNGLSVEYSDHKSIISNLKQIQNDINRVDWELLNKSDKIHQITIFISRIWQVHAFREGNTRTTCLFLYFFMKKYGLKLNVDFIGKYSKYFRNSLVIASIGQYSEYEYLERILLDATSVKVATNGDTKYKTIKEYNLDKYKYNYHHIKD